MLDAWFLKKDACVSELKKVPELLSNDREGKIIESIIFYKSGVFYGTPCTISKHISKNPNYILKFSISPFFQGQI